MRDTKEVAKALFKAAYRAVMNLNQYELNYYECKEKAALPHIEAAIRAAKLEVLREFLQRHRGREYYLGAEGVASVMICELEKEGGA